MNNIPSPCYKCADRYVGCHGKCNSYIQYQVKVRDFNSWHNAQGEQRRDIGATKLRLKKY